MNGGKRGEFGPMGPEHHPTPSRKLKELVLREEFLIGTNGENLAGRPDLYVRREQWFDYASRRDRAAALERVEWESFQTFDEHRQFAGAILLEFVTEFNRH